MAQIITAAQFRREQDEYRQIQGHGTGILKANFKDLSQKAKRFYLDSQEESFVFERGLVLELLRQPFTEYLRVYYGAIPEGNNPFNKAAGSPTIILGAARRINPYTDVSNDYLEWPEGLDENGNPVP